MAAFGNDVDRVEALKVIGGSGNACKGDEGPGDWKPPLQAACLVRPWSWLVVKVAYKELIERLPHTRRDRLTPLGWRVSVLFTKTHGRVLAP